MGKKRILVIDDEPTIVKLLSIRLQANEFDLISAGDGEEAVQIVKKTIPDLILIDILMPKMDGLTAMKEINKITNRKVPIIVITGKAFETKEIFELEGARDFLIKPIDGNALVKRIKELLNIG